MRYGGILGRHCNLLMIQHGEPGDGKSVALWLDVQILSHYDQVREKRAKKVYDRQVQQYRDSPGTAEEPAKEAPNSIFNKGTFIGLGGFMQAPR